MNACSPYNMTSEEERVKNPDRQFTRDMRYNSDIVDSYQVSNIQIIDDLFSWVWGIVYKVSFFHFVQNDYDSVVPFTLMT